MRYLTLIPLLAVVLTGCSSTPSTPNSSSTTALIKKLDVLKLVRYKEQPDKDAVVNNSTLKTIDYEHEDLQKNRFRIAPFSVGAWVNQKQGDVFHQIAPMSLDSAIVYFYRTDSSWNRQEIVAPNFFLNDERIPSLLNNHYYWIELPAGTYRLNISRPLGVAHFQKGTVTDFTVEAGKSYFLKYEEQQFRGKPNNNQGLLQVGPLIQMPTKQGLQEIATTTLKSPGLSFVKRGENENRELVTMNERKLEKVRKQEFEQRKPLLLTKPFVLWDPRTW